jgi:hypothetical protein
MGRPKTVEGADGTVSTMMCYVPSVLRIAFDKMCVERGFGSRSERIRDLMTRDLSEYKGEASHFDFPYEDKKRELLKLMQDEDKLVKDLQKEELERKRSAYDELCAFAVTLSGVKTLTKDTAKVLYKLHHYNFSGKEPFTKRHLEMFIQRYEIMIKRQVLQAEIDAHRKNGLHREDAANSDYTRA